jgi:hypothetical protein
MPSRSRSARRRPSRCHHQLERALLKRGVLEGALDLVGPCRVAPPVVEMLGDRVDAVYLVPGLLPVVSPAIPRPRKMPNTVSIVRSRFSCARLPQVTIDHPQDRSKWCSNPTSVIGSSAKR